MDNILNCKIDKQTIYQIYRACRLCGAGAGYKMPIIQNVVDLDARGIELKQKIRDCVQIEVHSDDKMPPLICELCVDKVNDYYDFMEMCQQSNKRTRARLGLPSSAGKDSADCILGITEKVYTNDDSDEPLSGTTKRSKNEAKVKIKVEKEIPKSVKSRGCQTDFREPSRPTENKSQNSREYRKVTDSSRESRKVSENSRESRKVLHNSRESRKVLENSRESRKVLENSRESRKQLDNKSRSSSPVALRVTRHMRPPTPPRLTRLGRTSNEENLSLSIFKNQTKKIPVPTKSILKKDKDVKSEDLSNLKRTRETPKPEIPQKKVKMSLPLKKQESTLACAICDKSVSNVQALSSHHRSHTVGFTSVKLACNACRDWFPSPEEASAHHRNHKARKRPYHCKRCGTKYKLQEGYDLHILSEECLPWYEVPDVKCEECWRMFPTRPLLEKHRCGGQDSRPGGKCMKCKRTYALQRNLKKHELTCISNKKTDVLEAPAALRRAAVRLARCDALLRRSTTCDASRVRPNYGLDPRCVYPYIRVKSELNKDDMVKIQAPVDAFDEEFVNWDSELTDSDEETNVVDSLTTIALKTIFSSKLLGKVPRQRRRIKTEKKAFESVLNASEFENDMRSNIDNIIDNLGNDDDDFIDLGSKLDDTYDNDSVHSESLLFDDFSKNNDGSGEKRKDNDSVNSESLLCDDGAVQNEGSVCNNAELNKPNDSQEGMDSKFNDLKENADDTRDSLRLSTKTDDISKTNVDELALNKDSSISTECEKEIKDATERSEEAKEIQENLNELSRLSKPENDEVLESRPDCEKPNLSSDVVDENTQIERHDNNSNDVNTLSESLNVDNKDEIVNNENTQIERRDSVNNVGTSSGSLNLDTEEADCENVPEEHSNTNIDTEGTNNTCIAQLTNGELEEKPDKPTCRDMNDERDEEKGDQNLNDDDIRENNDENGTEELVSENNDNNCTEKSSDNHATELARIENDENIRQYKENEAMCNDIENKINDLIAENKANENSLDNQDSSENSDKGSEINETTENNDNKTKEYVATGSSETPTDNDVTNNDVAVNNDSFPDNNEKDKITLEDLLPPKDSAAPSMDLDSISDTEFDFDA